MKAAIIVIAATLLALGPARAEQGLLIRINPDGRPPPSSIDLEADGEVPIPLAAAATPGSYQSELPQPTGKSWEVHYIVTARWPDGNRQLYLRITPETQRPLMLSMFNEDVSADQTTLNRLNALGADFNSLLEKYFVARDVYRQLMNGDSAVKFRALRLWYDTSYQLSKKYRFMDRDSEAEQFAKNTGDGYLLGMVKNAVAFDWQDTSHVQSLVKDGKVEQAQVLSAFLLDKYSRLDSQEQREVTGIAHVDLPTLSKSNDFASNLGQGSTR